MSSTAAGVPAADLPGSSSLFGPIAVRRPDETFSEFLNRPAVIPGDGRRVVRPTSSSNRVLNDTNGAGDVSAHGPLR